MKFCPSWWEVPAWSAQPSLIIASMESVYSAPANFSDSVLRPGTTGMQSHSSASSR